MTRVVVRVDDRLRLAGCLLAAGDWPEREQSLKPYRPHRVAEAARRALAAYRTHPAVQAAQSLAYSGTGNDPTSLFAHALAGDWPVELAAQVEDFAATAKVEQFYAEDAAEWRSAQSDLEGVLARGDLAGFLADLFGGLDRELAVHPNLLYPGGSAVAVSSAYEVVLSQPPPAAWGASPPWRYGERPDEVLGAVAEGLARPLCERALRSQPAGRQTQAGSLALATVVLFLRQAEGAEAAVQFMLMERRSRGLPQLPALVEALGQRQELGELLAKLSAEG